MWCNGWMEHYDHRFWAKVSVGDGCWVWRGARSGKGYGYCVRVQRGVRKNIPAHRLAWQEAFGDIPDGMCVCHSCDNRLCVNPSHLWLGTYADNNHDRVGKGRSGDMRGARSHRAKLTWEIVDAMRAEFTGAVGQIAAIARKYGVHDATTREVLRFKSWDPTARG